MRAALAPIRPAFSVWNRPRKPPWAITSARTLPFGPRKTCFSVPMAWPLVSSTLRPIWLSNFAAACWGRRPRRQRTVWLDAGAPAVACLDDGTPEVAAATEAAGLPGAALLPTVDGVAAPAAADWPPDEPGGRLAAGAPAWAVAALFCVPDAAVAWFPGAGSPVPPCCAPGSAEAFRPFDPAAPAVPLLAARNPRRSSRSALLPVPPRPRHPAARRMGLRTMRAGLHQRGAEIVLRSAAAGIVRRSAAARRTAARRHCAGVPVARQGAQVGPCCGAAAELPALTA